MILHSVPIPAQSIEKDLQKKRDVIDKELDPEEKDEGGCWHFFPAVWSNFANLSIVFYKEKLIIWPKMRDKKEERTLVARYRTTSSYKELYIIK